ncbi:hypothetical protein GCM10009814_28050 [Lapillicoccus jejuensis]
MVTTVGAVAAGLALTTGYGAPAHAAATSYVALGDSYSSGVGTRSYLDDGTSCDRSTLAYPSLIAAARGWTLSLRACSGATTADVTSTQLSALSSSTGVVTLSVGGNDAGFADVLTECAKPGWMSDCDGAIDTAQAFIAQTLPGRLSTLYAGVRSKAPHAAVTIVGYPRIFMGEDCNALTFFSPQEETRLNATADQLDSLLSQRASLAGFRYADPRTAFTGHAVCNDPEWLNGLSDPVSDSYHPNVDGHRSGYTPVVSAQLGAPVVATAAVVRRAEASAPRLAAAAAPYAALDARIAPERFRAPDLTTPQARAAAAAAGVDLADPASVRAVSQRYDARHAAERAAGR